MSRYMMINIGIILFPILFSFEKNIRFYRKLPALAASLGIVSTVYIIWDIIAASRGDWGFSELYTGTIRIGGLPLEEILFFVTVPYAIIFTYETIHFYIKDRQVVVPGWLTLSLAVILFTLSGIYYTQYYTATVMIFSGVFLLVMRFGESELFRSRNFYITLAVSYIPFFIVNYMLTSPPIVWYSPDAIWGPRFTTIPYEDFFYSFSMISWWTYFYHLFLKRFKIV
ncbi:MAG: hypothetical protein FMNOHCHN_00425 [Ignavibacteriaceae bacterium]|nr:hypothetical protein [Ignavibacteriaceae bacterium]MCK6613675.1 lycopene cyclase domain-containing protein [Ignavibacteriaceae bacterium]